MDKKSKISRLNIKMYLSRSQKHTEKNILKTNNKIQSINNNEKDELLKIMIINDKRELLRNTIDIDYNIC